MSVPATAADPLLPLLPCGEPAPGVPLYPSCVDGEVPKMDQRDTKRKGAEATGTTEQLTGTWKDGGTGAIQEPELSSPLSA